MAVVVEELATLAKAKGVNISKTLEPIFKEQCLKLCENGNEVKKKGRKKFGLDETKNTQTPMSSSENTKIKQQSFISR